MIEVDVNQLTEEQLAVVVSLDDLPTTPAGQHIKKNSDGSFSNSPDTGGSVAPTFETVSKNLDSYQSVLNYTGDNLASIVYDIGGGDFITKTFTYTGDNLTSIVLSGDIPLGIDTTKTLLYTGDNLTDISYS
jgi:hypothetical protein